MKIINLISGEFMLEDKNRREFIKVGGVATLGALFPWFKVFADDRAGMGAADRVRIGLIGVGSRGKALMENLKVMIDEGANIEIAAVCDNYQPHYERAIEECGNPKVKAFYNYKKMLEMKDLDAVVIATPLHEHAHIAIDSMEAGLQVFCEKAMARTLDDIKAMYETHKRTGNILQIGHQRMFDPKYLEGIEKIKNGELGIIGQIRAYWHRNNDWRREVPEDRPELEEKINWRLYREYSAGLLTELGSHQFQVANWAKDDSPISVMGTGSIRYWKDGREVYDNVATIFSYEDGTQFIWDSMTSNRKYGLQEQIMGDLGTMELETNKQYSENPPAAPGIRELINDIEHAIFDNIPIGGATWVPETAVEYDGEYISDEWEVDETKLQMEAFVRYIRNGNFPGELIREAYNASIWAIRAEQAIDSGEKLELPKKYQI